MSLAAFVRERDQALLSLNHGKIVAFMKRHDIPVPTPSAFWPAVHKARTAAVTLPMKDRSDSKVWLAMHGMQSLDDGDVPWGTGDDELVGPRS